MEYIATWERDTFEKGFDAGWLKGEKKGKLKGRIEGERIGEKKAKIATAKKMLRDGFKIDMIAEVTNLDTKTIKELAKEIPSIN